MKRLIIFSVFAAIFIFAQSVCGQAKYVFYFIGDGMGVNVVNTTEAWLSGMNGERGSVSLLMTQFPVASMATTFSANADITDSAAAGTALSTGKKTNNGTIGLDPDNNRLETIAERAKKAGKKVGVASTVPVNHATPAAFYGHQENRGMYYEITQDLILSGFDFFGGAGFYNRDKFHDKTDAPDIFPLIEQAGYVIAKGFDDFRANAGRSKKVVLVQKNWEKVEGIPYAIDRKGDDLTLKQITEAAIDVLTRDNKKGFFLMLEGGRIDWAAHGNDAATAVREVIDMDEAIRVAYEFYKKHPKETLIVITADHDTGGITAGTGRLNINALQYQKQSQDGLTALISDLRTSRDGKVSWEEIKDLLTKTLGFWQEIPLNWEQEKILRDAYEETLAKNRDVKDRNLYAENSLIAAKAKQIMNDVARLGWGTTSHSGGYVPVFAIGAGQDLFTHKMDNTDIPLKIIKAAKY
ncbi:MAG: alkaline phosphatase [Tannerella sp.]|jgi:alkaline phosphatase|nr:alkaline phosphatase [Tannerella sp.]